MCLAERANLIQSGQPIDGGEREIAPERVAMPCDARSSPFVVIGSPGARMEALRADDTNSHCGSVAFTGAFACVHGLYSINAGQTSRSSANAAFIPSMAPADPESAEFEGLQRINPFLEGRVSCARAPTRTRMRSQDNPFAPPDENAVELVVWSGWAKKGGMGAFGDGRFASLRKWR